jgi:GDP-L-fucose synthase
MFMSFQPEGRVFIAGHRGMVGSAIWRELSERGFRHLLGHSHAELDLLEPGAVNAFYREQKPEFVFIAAAKVGRILANDSRPAQFLFENLQIQNNLIHGAYLAGVKKLLFLGSSCIYPKQAPQPLNDDSLLSGPLEPTNQWYAIAKIAGLKLCQAYRRQYGCNFISAMPTNLYGPGDNYDSNGSHVIPALLCKFHEAKTNFSHAVSCWGSGKPLREFLYVDDLARACVLLMKSYDEERPINIGAGEELSIQALAKRIRHTVGYDGQIVWDTSKPDGTPRKVLDSSRMLALGWRPKVNIETGLQLAYVDFLNRRSSLRGCNKS